MSDWRLSAGSSNYKEALKATESLEEPACGFLKPNEIPKTTLTSALIKQNNTIIQLLVKIQEEVETCKEAIKRIETAKAKVVSTDDLTNSIEEIQKGLNKLNLGENQPRSRKPKGQFFVFKNPKEIFEAEKRK